ncbi:MAG: hypothetical protein QOF42_2454 [Gammaproteobacteria bacterium]|jgi:hypothetical protein|nr:hypothetical protein [Gammaproteobacteria bacterium]
MCRSIKTLFNFQPPVTDNEVRAAALQFVRKVSGFTHPSKTNEPAFVRAVDEVEAASRRMLDSLQTNAPAKSREEEAAKAKIRSAQRFIKVAG